MPPVEPAAGQVWQSRDEAYEPGRRVRLSGGRGGRFTATTIANPRRPERVGRQTDIRRVTLLHRWRHVTEPVTPETPTLDAAHSPTMETA